MLPSFRVLVLWLHLLGVVVWVGGLAFQVLVVEGLLKRASSVAWLRLSVSLEARFRYVLWPAVGLVLLTGLFNVMNLLYATALTGGSVSSRFVHLLSIKLLLAVLMIGLQAVQRFALYPRTVVLLAHLASDAADLPGELLTLRRRSRLLSLCTISTAVVVILVGLLLGR